MQTDSVRMTDTQRRGLHLANRKGGAKVQGPGRNLANDQIAYKTAQALIAKGWATQPAKVLFTTTEGRKALVAPVYDDGYYLHNRMHRGYTTDAKQACKGEPQPMDKPSTTWQAEAQRAQAEAKLRTRTDRKTEAGKLASIARNSGRHGWRTTAPASPVTVSYLAA